MTVDITNSQWLRRTQCQKAGTERDNGIIMFGSP